MMPENRSQILGTVHETAVDLYHLGLIDRHRVRFYEEISHTKAPEDERAVNDTKAETGQSD